MVCYRTWQGIYIFIYKTPDPILKSHLHEVCWVSNHNLSETNPTPTTAQVVHFIAGFSLFQKKASEISCSSDFQAVRVTSGCLELKHGEGEKQFLEGIPSPKETPQSAGGILGNS